MIPIKQIKSDIAGPVIYQGADRLERSTDFVWDNSLKKLQINGSLDVKGASTQHNIISSVDGSDDIYAGIGVFNITNSSWKMRINKGGGIQQISSQDNYFNTSGATTIGDIANSVSKFNVIGNGSHGIVSVVDGTDDIYVGLGILNGLNWKFRVNKSGDTGIGLNVVTARLHVQGIDATSSNYVLKLDNTSANMLSVRNDGNTNINGRVGIGAVSSDEALFITNTNGDNSRIKVVNQLAGGSYITFDNAGTSNLGFVAGVDGTGLGIIGHQGNFDVNFRTNNIVRLTIKANGNILSLPLYSNTTNSGTAGILGIDDTGKFYNTGVNPTTMMGGSGTTNYISKWTSGSTLGNSLLFDNGTNVGIGTALPGFKLSVITSTAGDGIFLMNNSSQYLAALQRDPNSGTPKGYLALYDSSGNSQVVLNTPTYSQGDFINTGRNLGIGDGFSLAVGAVAKVHIAATGAIPTLMVTTASAHDASIKLATNSSATMRGNIYVDHALQTFNFYTLNSDTIFWNGNGLAQSKTLTLFTNTTAKFENTLYVGSNITLDGLDITNYPITIRSARVDLTRMQLLNGGATQTDLQIATNNGANSIYYGVSAANNAFIDNRTTGHLLFQNGGTTQMTFTTAGKLGLGLTPTAFIELLGDGSSNLIRLNNNYGLYNDKFRVSNDGSFFSCSDNVSGSGLGGSATGLFHVSHLNFKFDTSFSTYLAFTNAGGAGNKTSYGIIGSTIGNADSDFRLTILNNDAGTPGSILKLVSTATSSGNDGFDYYHYGVNIITHGAYTNIGSGTFYKIGLNVDLSGGDVNYAALFNGGFVGIGLTTPTATTHIKGDSSGALAYTFKADNLAGNNLLRLANDGYFEAGDLALASSRYKFNLGSSQNFIIDGSSHPTFLMSQAGVTFFTLTNTAFNEATMQSTGILDIRAGGASTLYARFNEGAGGIGINIQNPTARLHIVGIDSTSSNYGLKVDDIFGNPILHVRNNGNVGIGGTSIYSNYKLQILTSNANDGIQIIGSGVGTALLTTDSDANSGILKLWDHVQGDYTLQLRTINNSFVNTSYNFGIGTNNPLDKLSVNAVDTKGISLYNAANNYIQHKIGTSTVFGGFYEMYNSSGTSVIRLSTLDSYVLGNNFGIGLNNPTAKAHIVGIDSTSSNYGLKVENSSLAPMFYVANNGSVSINGGIDPLYALTIGSKATGAIRMFNSIFADILTVTDAGYYNFYSGTRMGIGVAASSNTSFFVQSFNALTTGFGFQVAETGGVSTFFSVRNDGFITINGTTVGAAKLEVTGGAYQGIYVTSSGQIGINAVDTTGIANKAETATGTAYRANITNVTGIALDLYNTTTVTQLFKVLGDGKIYALPTYSDTTNSGTSRIVGIDNTGKLFNTDVNPDAINTGTIGITIDGSGSVITTGFKQYVVIPYNCVITDWYIIADVVGSIVIDVWKDTSIPTVSNTIAGSEKPTLSSQQNNSDNNLTTWTTTVTAGDIIGFNVDSVSTITKATLVIKIRKT